MAVQCGQTDQPIPHQRQASQYTFYIMYLHVGLLWQFDLFHGSRMVKCDGLQ